MARPRPHWFPDVWAQLPLPQMSDDDDEDRVEGTGRWSFAVVTLEPSGRLTLPAAARAAVDDRSSLRASTRGEVVVLRCDSPGRPVAVDGRGRLVVPRWLRDAAGPDGALLVGVRPGHDDGPVVLLAPTRLLAAAADVLVGEGW